MAVWKSNVISVMELYIKGEKVNIKPINNENLLLLNFWYHQMDSFGFATGGKSLAELLAPKENSFVSGIYTNDNISCIGTVSGQFTTIKENVLWIRTLLIDTAWQRKQFGTHSFNLLCDYAAENFMIKRVYLSVSAENFAAKIFWRKMGMSCIKTLRGNEPLKSNNVLIFEKVI